MHPTYMQAEYTFVEQMQAASRRPAAKQNRGRVAGSPGVAGGGGGGGGSHLLDDSSNILAVTVGVDQLTNA